MNKTLAISAALFLAAFIIGLVVGFKTGTTFLEQSCVDGLHWSSNGRTYHCIAFEGEERP